MGDLATVCQFAACFFISPSKFSLVQCLFPFPFLLFSDSVFGFSYRIGNRLWGGKGDDRFLIYLFFFSDVRTRTGCAIVRDGSWTTTIYLAVRSAVSN